MGFLFGREARSTGMTFAEPPIPPYLGADVTGRPTIAQHPDAALQVSTVWACVGLVANAVSTMELCTYRKVAGVQKRIDDPPLIRQPAAGMTQSEWLHTDMVSLLMRGNAVGKIVARDTMERPTQIEIQNPDAVDITVDRQTGSITWKINRVEVPASSIWHVRGLTLPGHPVGLSPISYAAATIGIDLFSRKFASDLFAGGGIPKAVVTAAGDVKQADARAIKEKILAASKDREPMVLGNGLTYTPIQINPEESQFLATQQANVGQIARFFNVPAGMVGGTEGGSMTYSNTEQRSIDFLTFCLAFWLKRLEDSISLLLPAGQYVKFDTSSLLRTDAETATKISVQRIAAKIIAPSEERAVLGLPPMTEAQKTESDMVPLTVTPLGGAKALPALKEPPGPSAPVPADDNEGADNGG